MLNLQTFFFFFFNFLFQNYIAIRNNFSATHIAFPVFISTMLIFAMVLSKSEQFKGNFFL